MTAQTAIGKSVQAVQSAVQIHFRQHKLLKLKLMAEILLNFTSGTKKISKNYVTFEKFYIKYEEPNRRLWHNFFLKRKTFPKSGRTFGSGLATVEKERMGADNMSYNTVDIL